MKSKLTLELGKSLHDAYQKAYPYPHISIDDFIPIEDIRLCVREMEHFNDWGIETVSLKDQVKKNFYPWQQNKGEIEYTLSTQAPTCWKWLCYFNSKEFIKALENLTGIKNLMPDWGFSGGGLHQIESGGKLSIHSDYNKHPEDNTYRRINLLLYLNENWDPTWGGTLQVWKKDMSEMISEFQPYAGKVIIFNTTDDALHGHPHPLNSPIGKNRNSLALYYFTKDRPESEKSNFTSAQWYEPGNPNKKNIHE